MTKETMTIHEALAELKTLDKRIAKAIKDTSFCSCKSHRADKVDGVSVQQFIDMAKEGYAKVTDLINRRAAIKKAVVLSNATSTVEVMGVEFTIAEAIEMKNKGIGNHIMLWNAMRNEYTDAKDEVEEENRSVESRADRYIADLFGQKEVKAKAAEASEEREKYIKTQTWELVDPIDIAEEIQKVGEFIDGFSSKIDAKISVSNAQTVIEIEY